MDGEDSQLYSATKQQARRVVIQNNPENKQPIRLRNDVMKLEEQDTGISSYWVKIPVYNPEKERGESIWCSVIIPQKDRGDVEECEFGDSELG
ncbi:MAG: hypothetical protein BTN85_1891 [Candidatus Methanohalarchaeum thermophilum]|uniref:Uncharacterized protein n=1 Tax=Methanohalarchaeum thermophilum TaxID=1903181 RepID=A0A1Q6DSC0_METT1|nr:MAG: hypothetical protein BTN85_1891 [Candidatus Methanohalarchaeum thermophilum]